MIDAEGRKVYNLRGRHYVELKDGYFAKSVSTSKGKYWRIFYGPTTTYGVPKNLHPVRDDSSYLDFESVTDCLDFINKLKRP